MVSQYTNWFILRFSQKIFRGVFPYDDQTTKGDYKKKLIKGGVVQHFICDQLLYLVNDVNNPIKENHLRTLTTLVICHFLHFYSKIIT